MDKYKRYYGVIVFCVAIILLIFGFVQLISPKVTELNDLKASIEQKQGQVSELENKLNIVKQKIKKIKNSIISSQKKIYSPIESDLGNETLFFTLYNDVIEMVHSNSVKIKAIDYTYNPETDELVSNYVNLGKLIQDLYQYPYYIKINEIEVKPYQKDKKILITNLSLRMYAHTEPDDTTNIDAGAAALPLNGANTQLPQ